MSKNNGFIEEMRKSAELNLKVAKEKTSKLKNDTRQHMRRNKNGAIVKVG